MKVELKTALLLAAATFSCAVSWAQDADPAELVKAARAAIRQIDEGSAGSFWEGMSSAVKQRVSRKDFTEAVLRSRQPLGSPGERYWVLITRQKIEGNASTPPGLYGSVEFASTFAGQKTLRELISFRLDEDKVWRTSGYTVRAAAR